MKRKMWRPTLVAVFLCLVAVEAGRPGRKNGKPGAHAHMQRCETDEDCVGHIGEGVFQCREPRRRSHNQEEESESAKFCKPPVCESNDDCPDFTEQYGFSGTCLLPRKKQCYYQPEVFQYNFACRVARISDASLIGEKPCPEGLVCQPGRNITFNDEEYSLSKCVPEGENQRAGKGRDREGRRQRGRGQNNLEIDGEEEEQTKAQRRAERRENRQERRENRQEQQENRKERQGRRQERRERRQGPKTE